MIYIRHLKLEKLTRKHENVGSVMSQSGPLKEAHLWTSTVKRGARFSAILKSLQSGVDVHHGIIQEFLAHRQRK